MSETISPEVDQATKALFAALSEKDSVENYPCKDTPCEYWWVRYATACTYLKESFDKIWLPKLEEIKQKYGIELFAYQGHFNYDDCTRNKKLLKAYLNRRIIITWLNTDGERQERSMTENTNDGELFDVLDRYLQESEKVQWRDCPYQMERQSVCPFYKESEFYKKRKELASKNSNKMKGEP